ncbi:MAG TPA: NAD-dependent epimerase/dehydratase family protein [Pseudomonadota bacterium]|nr:NAD-dependent epimerase/dehydratase family protein [Pseudomonadota bacterium]
MNPICDSGMARGKVLLTGASGHLGANLLHRLVQDGEDVRVLLRAGSNNSAVDGLSVDRIYGDLRDPRAVDEAVKGCVRIYHTAAKVSTIYGNAAHKREIYDSNVVGTRNLLAAALQHGVSRVVVTGSFSAIGYDHDNPTHPANEDMRLYPFERTMPYEVSKTFVELESLAAVSRGLDVSIATSCAILGPHDYKPSRMGRALCDYANGKLRAYIDGGFEFVSARDLVEGHILTMQRGRKGERYIFSTEYKSLPDMMQIWERITGRPGPRLKVPAPLMEAIAEVVSPVLSYLAPDFPQRLTPSAVRLLRLGRHADITKAKTELGYTPTTVEEACREAYQFFARRGAIHSPVQA